MDPPVLGDLASDTLGRFTSEPAYKTELDEIFAGLGISRYVNRFIEQGFDSWDTVLDITETDLGTLGVKLGHRRKLQRKIAGSKGLSLAPPARSVPGKQRISSAKARATFTGCGLQGAKRNYRWRPKPDENAPTKPLSAYVLFSNKSL